MARARTIKPAFFSNEDLGELPFEARLLFAGLWCLADKNGIVEYRIKRIKGEIFRYDDMPAVKLHDLAVKLHGKKFISFHAVDGGQFIHITNFAKHQRPHPKEADGGFPQLSKDTEVSIEAVKLNGEPCNYPANCASYPSPLSPLPSPSNPSIPAAVAADPVQENPKPKKTRKQPTGNHAELVRHFEQIWLERYGVAHETLRKDCVAMATVLKAGGNLESGKAIVAAYFSCSEPFIVNKKHPATTLASEINRFKAAAMATVDPTFCREDY